MIKDAETTNALYPLSDRIAALDGPHRGVDVEIADAVNWAIDWHGRPYRKHPHLLVVSQFEF